MDKASRDVARPGGDLVEACAERDGDGLGHPAAAEPAVGQVDVIGAFVSAIGRRRDFPHLAWRAVNATVQPVRLTALPA